MKAGIPKGTALGPLLFLIYMNDLPSRITNGLLLQYADDTTLICSGFTVDKVAATLNTQLSDIQCWVTASKTKLNLKKSTVMWFWPLKDTNTPLLLWEILFFMLLMNRST